MLLIYLLLKLPLKKVKIKRMPIATALKYQFTMRGGGGKSSPDKFGIESQDQVENEGEDFFNQRRGAKDADPDFLTKP